MMHTLRPVLLTAGVVAAVMAVGWWWLTFGALVQTRNLSIGEAGACLVRGSSLCDLAAALCTTRHQFLAAAYDASAFWIAVAALATGIALQMAAPQGVPVRAPRAR